MLCPFRIAILAKAFDLYLYRSRLTMVVVPRVLMHSHHPHGLVAAGSVAPSRAGRISAVRA